MQRAGQRTVPALGGPRDAAQRGAGARIAGVETAFVSRETQTRRFHQKSVVGHLEPEPTRGPQEAGHFQAERFQCALEGRMRERAVKGDHGIERGVVPGQRLVEVAEDDPHGTRALVALCKHVGRRIEADHFVPRVEEGGELSAGTDPEIEHAPRRPEDGKQRREPAASLGTRKTEVAVVARSDGVEKCAAARHSSDIAPSVRNWLTPVRCAIASRLERGAGLPFSFELDPVRGLRLPAVPVVGVGGALLGGSGCTPLSIAIAAHLGPRAAWLGRGYPARVAAPRRVGPQDDADAVGDEAVLAYRKLAPLGTAVWVGPREATLHAARADVLVVDGLLQSRARLALSVLALSAPAPWGSGQQFPRGDLRADPARLVALADHVVLLTAEASPVDHAPNAEVARTTVTLPDLPPRYGLLLGLGRPERIGSMLPIAPRVTLRAPDHRTRAYAERANCLAKLHQLDTFLVTEKCDAALGDATLPRLVLRYEVDLPSGLRTHIDRLVAPSHAERPRGRVSS